jgi:thymidylate synthase (FAD)
VLPEGNTQSRLYMAGTLRSWLHYCILRTELGTQKEHRIVAEQCFDIVKREFPSIAGLFTDKD